MNRDDGCGCVSFVLIVVALFICQWLGCLPENYWTVGGGGFR